MTYTPFVDKIMITGIYSLSASFISVPAGDNAIVNYWTVLHPCVRVRARRLYNGRIYIFIN